MPLILRKQDLVRYRDCLVVVEYPFTVELFRFCNDDNKYMVDGQPWLVTEDGIVDHNMLKLVLPVRARIIPFSIQRAKGIIDAWRRYHPGEYTTTLNDILRRRRRER